MKAKQRLTDFNLSVYYGNPIGGIAHACGTNHVCSGDEPPAVASVPCDCQAILRRLPCAVVSLSGSVLHDGVRTVDIPGEFAGHRDVPAS